MEIDHLRIWVDILTLVLIVVGAIIWGVVGITNFNPIDWLGKRTHPWVARSIYILVGLAALLHVASREYYLPFLGQSAFPCGSLIDRVPLNANTAVEIQTEPNKSIIYWAAESGTKIQHDPWMAYKDYANAGVTKSDSTGKAVLRFRLPSQYNVNIPYARTLKPHVHYRVCKSNGLIGKVQTSYLS